MAKIATLIFTDGRGEFLKKTIRSWQACVVDGIPNPILWDDSGDAEYQEFLRFTFPYMEMHFNDTRIGFRKTVQKAWSSLPSEYDYVVQLEDDFILRQGIYLLDWIELMESNPHLCQLVALRQPWYPPEISASGVYQHIGLQFFTEKSLTLKRGSGERQVWWTEHCGRFWTMNPCLVPRDIINIGYPDEPKSEIAFRRLLPEGRKCAFFGKLASPVVVEHIGVHTDNRTLKTCDMNIVAQGF